MIFRTDLKAAAMAAQQLARPDRARAAQKGRHGTGGSSLGGRPTELAFAPDGDNPLRGQLPAPTLSRSSTRSRPKLVKTIPLGGPKTLSLARRGEIVFHDAEHSFNQWYSCNTCHSDGHTDGLDFDTLNDGRQDLSTFHLRSRKKVPTLRRVTKTKPWTWHGWQTSLDDAMVESFTKSMQGPKPKAEDVQALIAYLGTLDYPKNPFRQSDGSLDPGRRARSRCLPFPQSRLQYVPRRPRAHRRQDPRSWARRARRRLSWLQPSLAPRPVRQGPLSPRRPRQNPARCPERTAQRRQRHRPRRIDATKSSTT